MYMYTLLCRGPSITYCTVSACPAILLALCDCSLPVPPPCNFPGQEILMQGCLPPRRLILWVSQICGLNLHPVSSAPAVERFTMHHQSPVTIMIQNSVPCVTSGSEAAAVDQSLFRIQGTQVLCQKYQSECRLFLCFLLNPCLPFVDLFTPDKVGRLFWFYFHICSPALLWILMMTVDLRVPGSIRWLGKFHLCSFRLHSSYVLASQLPVPCSALSRFHDQLLPVPRGVLTASSFLLLLNFTHSSCTVPSFNIGLRPLMALDRSHIRSLYPALPAYFSAPIRAQYDHDNELSLLLKNYYFVQMDLVQ